MIALDIGTLAGAIGWTVLHSLWEGAMVSDVLAAEAKLADGSQAYMKLKREPGADGKGVVLKNVNYFNAVQNDGFQLYRSTEHRADLAGHQFS